MPSPRWDDHGLAAERTTPAATPPAAPRRRPLVAQLTAAVALTATIATLIILQPWDAQRRQAYADQFAVWSTPPSAQVEEIATVTGMTEAARLIFFASQPVIADAETFNTHCDIEASTVLGCYDGDRIYVYRVTDERLAGSNEVTAAHEMLHAAFVRLDTGTRTELRRLIEEFVGTLEPDHAVRVLVDGYPEAQRLDEWHSRLATEFSLLPPELETYYARYFQDRSTVIALHDAANAEFREFEAMIEGLVREIRELGPELDRRGEQYDAQLAAYDADVADFNARADDGAFPSQEAFDAERAALLERQLLLDAERRELNADVEHYNELVAQLNALDASYAELYAQLDSGAAADSV